MTAKQLATPNLPTTFLLTPHLGQFEFKKFSMIFPCKHFTLSKW